MNFWADSIWTAQNPTPNVGELGEQLVAGWLQTQNFGILHHRWRCRWGEIDLIAYSGAGERFRSKGASEQGDRGEGFTQLGNKLTPHLFSSPLAASPLLAFVEVKTRRRGNWDADGLLAITQQKQAKLWQTAQLFLAENPDLANLPCRFDVALVSCQSTSQRFHCKETDLSASATGRSQLAKAPAIELGQPILVPGYRLILQDYIQSAFD